MIAVMLRAPLFLSLLTIAGPAAAQDAVVYVSRDDYAALAPAGAEGVAVVDLRFSADGAVQTCSVRKTSGNAALDAASCGLLRERGWPGSSEAKLKNGAETARLLWRKPVAPLPPGPGWGGASPIDPQNFVRHDDYPSDALRRGEQGLVGFEIDISATGRVTACRVTASSNSPSLDAVTCKNMVKRGRFVPASDGKGGRRATTGGSKMNWESWGTPYR